jgi:hypothetical protein
VEWLQPYTDTTIEELGAAGVKNLLAVPVSFVSEHIETLEEIDMEYRELAEESGITNWGRVPALNTNSVFIDDLAQVRIRDHWALRSTVTRLGCSRTRTERRPQPRTCITIRGLSEKGASRDGGRCSQAVMEAMPYLGVMAAREPTTSLVPSGSVEELLEVYDRERMELPPPVSVWEWGFTKSAETWNGRLARACPTAHSHPTHALGPLGSRADGGQRGGCGCSAGGVHPGHAGGGHGLWRTAPDGRSVGVRPEDSKRGAAVGSGCHRIASCEDCT